jgi:hypothetical protein
MTFCFRGNIRRSVVLGEKKRGSCKRVCCLCVPVYVWCVCFPLPLACMFPHTALMAFASGQDEGSMQ